MDFQSKNHEFIIAGSNVIKSQKVGTVHLLLLSEIMILLIVAYTPKCDSNLISLSQLHKSKILYHNYPNSMIFKQRGSTIGVARRYKNVFILETGIKDKAMIVQKRGQPTYLLSLNPQIRLWQRRLSYASNARVIQASKLVDKIDFAEATEPDNEPHFSDSEVDNENNKSEDDAYRKPININKKMEYNLNDVKELCEACIKSKHTRIIKLKKMTPITKKLQKVHTDL